MMGFVVAELAKSFVMDGDQPKAYAASATIFSRAFRKALLIFAGHFATVDGR